MQPSNERKRKLVTIDTLKSTLSGWGFPTVGKKAKLQETVNRVEAMKLLASHAAIDHQWTQEELDVFFSGLPVEEYHRWQPQEVCLVQQLVNTRFVRQDVMNIAHYAELIGKMEEYYQNHLTSIPRLKDQTVTADSLSPVFELLNKKVEKWNDKDGDLLLQYLGNVARVDARSSSADAIEKYCELLSKLSIFYARRPDIRVKVDPELVIFDLSAVGLNLVTYTKELAAYVLPAHFGPMPTPTNPGPTATVFAMPNLGAANHFIAWMMARVANLRASLQPGAPGGILIY